MSDAQILATILEALAGLPADALRTIATEVERLLSNSSSRSSEVAAARSTADLAVDALEKKELGGK